MDLKAKFLLALSSLNPRPSTSSRAAVHSAIAAAISRSTTSRDNPVDDRHVHEILFLVANSPESAPFLARRLTHRLEGARDRVVALKALNLLHRLLRGGDRQLEVDIRDLHAAGVLRLDLRRFHAEPDYPSSFLRYYASFMEERIRWAITPAGGLDTIKPPPESTASQTITTRQEAAVLQNLCRSQDFLEKILGGSFHPMNLARSKEVARSAMAMVLKESFLVYTGFLDGIDALLQFASHLGSDKRVIAISVLRRAAIHSQRLRDFYQNCKAVVSPNGLNYPDVRIITAEDVYGFEKLAYGRGEQSMLNPKRFSSHLKAKAVADQDENFCSWNGSSSSKGIVLHLLPRSTTYSCDGGMNSYGSGRKMETVVCTEWVGFE